MVERLRLFLNAERVESAPFAPPRSASELVARAWLIVATYSWLFAALTALVLGYLLVWQRGLYFDDYSNRAKAIDLMTGESKPPWASSRLWLFPGRILSTLFTTYFSEWLPTNELLVRFVIVLGIAANVFLLGWLVYRLLGSRLAAVISGWLFLMPVFAPDAVLWLSALDYVFGLTLTLIFLHASWSALQQPQRRRRWIFVGATAFAAALFFRENFVSSAGLVPVFALVLAAQNGTRERWTVFKRALLVLLAPALATLLFFMLLTTNSTVVGRGGVDASPAGLVARSGEYLQKLGWMTVSPEFGEPLHRGIFQLGIHTLAESWKGMLLLTALVALLVLSIVTWRSDEREFRQPFRLGFVTVGAGVLWFFAALLLPGILVKDQILEYRMLYLPGAVAAAMLSALAWMLAKWLRRTVWARMLLALASALLVLSTIGMVGYARAFAARYELDRQQIAAVVRELPTQYLPPNSYVVVFDTDERLLARATG